MGRADFDIRMSGTAAVVVFVRGDQLYTANVGDSRVVLATQTAKGVQPVELTFDQKPEMAGERKRIVAAGGIVEPILDPYDGPVGPCRVWVKEQALPGLAMSRSLGDSLAASVGVCPDPVVNSFKVRTRTCFKLHSPVSFVTSSIAQSGRILMFSATSCAECGSLCASLKPAWTSS